MNPPQKYLLFHMPKTGGTTIYQEFKQWVGKAHFETFRREHLPEALQNIRPETTVINGHFDFKDLETHLDLETWRMVVWLRNPVDRVISNYHHFIRSIRDPHPKGMEMARLNSHRVNETLLTYAGQPDNKNRMHQRLDGARFEDFYFIGQQERLPEDLRRLAQRIGMPLRKDVPIRNAGTYTVPDPSVLAQIAEWNQEDLALWTDWTKRLEREQP